MTVEERINAMNKKIESDKKKENESEQLREKQLDEAMEDVVKLFGRVKDIIRLGVYCINNKIEFPNGKYYEYRQAYNDFESDGIRHYFGFIGEDGYLSHGGEVHVGWNNGGFCGVWDVHCNGNELWLQHEKDKNNKRKIDSIDDIKRFIKDFEKFEKNFYEWFDEMCGK